MQTGVQHLVAMKEVLQFFVAVLNAVAIELQEPALSRAGPAVLVLFGQEIKVLWGGGGGVLLGGGAHGQSRVSAFLV